jgi:pyruvate dehydrogenase E2 component (dihydrolipoamide acetyltransferase)
VSSETVRLSLSTGAEVHALVLGSDAAHRPKCLLLHGNPRSLSDWEPVMAELSPVADVAAIDLPGFGQSPRSSRDPDCMTLARLAEHAVAVADALGWHEPFFIVGHSHGGGVAQAAAVRYPQRVAGVVLVATLGGAVHSSYRLLAVPGAAGVVGVAGRLFGWSALRPLNRWLMRQILKAIFAPEKVPKSKADHELTLFAARPEVLLSMVHVAQGRPCEHLLAAAPGIRCPVLFLHGDADALVPARCARVLHDRIRDAGGRTEFQLLPAAGHMLLYFQAAQVSARIARFVNS